MTRSISCQTLTKQIRQPKWRQKISIKILAKKDQQRTDDSALDMMQGMHEHEDHEQEDKE